MSKLIFVAQTSDGIKEMNSKMLCSTFYSESLAEDWSDAEHSYLCTVALNSPEYLFVRSFGHVAQRR